MLVPYLESQTLKKGIEWRGRSFIRKRPLIRPRILKKGTQYVYFDSLRLIPNNM